MRLLGAVQLRLDSRGRKAVHEPVHDAVLDETKVRETPQARLNPPRAGFLTPAFYGSQIETMG